MHVRTSVSLAALALVLAAPALAQQPGPLSDFQLPPDPDETATPTVEGPVDPDAPVRTAPRTVPTDRPTPRPTAQPTPRIPLDLPPPEPTPRPQPTATQRSEPPPRATQAPAEQAPAGTPVPSAETATGQPSAATGTTPDFTPPSAPAVPAGSSAAAPEEGGSLVPWLAALVAALAAAGAGYWFLRRREELAPVPVVEPPLARREPKPDPRPAPTPEAAPPPQPSFAQKADGVSLAARPVRFSRSIMNATFAYRVVLENRGGEAWEDLAIEADLVTAHGSAPIAEQLADADAPLAPMGTVPTLAPGETVEVAGDVRLSLQQVRAIPQGRAAVYVPLLRLRVAAKGKPPVARTFLVGQLPDREGGKLQPFRLDEMPQVYQAIGMRPLD